MPNDVGSKNTQRFAISTTETSTERSRTQAGGQAAVHPAQIGAINAALTPSAEAVQKARAILAENAKGVGTVGGQMIDEAIARKARRTLAASGLET
jgi:citrate lyase beta subunit